MPTMQCRPPKLKFQFHTIPVNRRNVSHSRHSPHWGTTTHRNSSHFHRIRRKQNIQFVRLIISRRIGTHRQSTVAAAKRSTTRATSKWQKEKNRKKSLANVHQAQIVTWNEQLNRTGESTIAPSYTDTENTIILFACESARNFYIISQSADRISSRRNVRISLSDRSSTVVWLTSHNMLAMEIARFGDETKIERKKKWGGKSNLRKNKDFPFKEKISSSTNTNTKENNSNSENSFTIQGDTQHPRWNQITFLSADAAKDTQKSTEQKIISSPIRSKNDSYLRRSWKQTEANCARTEWIF